jgi:hypothetical protein
MQLVSMSIHLLAGSPDAAAVTTTEEQIYT